MEVWGLSLRLSNRYSVKACCIVASPPSICAINLPQLASHPRWQNRIGVAEHRMSLHRSARLDPRQQTTGRRRGSRHVHLVWWYLPLIRFPLHRERAGRERGDQENTSILPPRVSPELGRMDGGWGSHLGKAHRSNKRKSCSSTSTWGDGGVLPPFFLVVCPAVLFSSSSLFSQQYWSFCSGKGHLHDRINPFLWKNEKMYTPIMRLQPLFRVQDCTLDIL